MPLKYIMMITGWGVNSRHVHHGYWNTYLRIHGKALRTEIITKRFVIMPVTITERCCTARYRMMSTILNTSQLKTQSVLRAAELGVFLPSTGKCATRMNTSDMLQYRNDCHLNAQWSPLNFFINTSQNNSRRRNVHFADHKWRSYIGAAETTHCASELRREDSQAPRHLDGSQRKETGRVQPWLFRPDWVRWREWRTFYRCWTKAGRGSIDLDVS